MRFHSTNVWSIAFFNAPVYLDEIAQRAGIGNAALCRHFPTCCELIVAVFTEQMQAYADAARTAAEADDGWAGLRDYVRTICGIQASNRGLADVLTTSRLNDETLLALRRSAHRDITRESVTIGRRVTRLIRQCSTTGRRRRSAPA